MLRIGVEQRHFDLTAIAGINGARRVHDRDAMLERQATAWHDETDVPVWQRYCNAGSHGGALAGRQRHGIGRHEIGAGVPWVCVIRLVVGLQQYLNRFGHPLRLGHCAPVRTFRQAHLDTLRRMYRERVWPTPTWFLAAGLLVPAVILALAPINLTLGIVLSVLIYLGAVWFFIGMSPVVEVSETELRAGRGRIERTFLGEARVVGSDEMFEQLHSGLDARAWLCLRNWTKGLVRIELADPNDPTPYWLVSTRHPDALVAALSQR